MVEIAERYRGEIYVAITSLNGDIYYRMALSQEKLDETLSRDIKYYKGEFLVLTRFPGINGEALSVLEEASQRLNQGKLPCLDLILSDIFTEQSPLPK